MLRWTRRRLLRLLSATAATGPLSPLMSAAPAAAAPLDRVRSLITEPQTSRQSRTVYRADATLLLLGVPVFTCAMAGAAVAEAHETRSGDECLLSFLFTAGSEPERARGLNRLGYFEEALLERRREPCHAAYFGFVTSSPEADASEGRVSLDKQPDEALYEVIDGEVRDGFDAALRHDLWMPANLDWHEVRALDRRIRERVEHGDIAHREANRNEAPISTFLYSVMTTAWAGEPEVELQYTFNGKLYRMNARSEPDTRQGERFAEKGLECDPANVTRVEGQVTGLTKPSQAKFRLWMAERECPALPIRIECKLRGFLRVAFQQDPSRHAPV